VALEAGPARGQVGLEHLNGSPQAGRGTCVGTVASANVVPKASKDGSHGRPGGGGTRRWPGQTGRPIGSTIALVESSAPVLGVHVAAGVAWLAPTSSSGDLVRDLPDRLQVGAGVDSPRGLAELEESLEELIRNAEMTKVAVLKPGSSTRPKRPTLSIQRGRMEGAIFIATSRSSCQLLEVSHQEVEKVTGVRPTDKSFDGLMSDRLSGPAPTRWALRAPAFGAALTTLGHSA
jgi:hypothetical protein